MKSTTDIDNNNSRFTKRFPSQHSVGRLLTLLSSGLLLGALSLSAQAGSLISHGEYLEYELPKKIQEKCTARDNCADIEVK